MTALMCEQPEDPVIFLETCLAKVRDTNGITYEWSNFNTLVLKSKNGHKVTHTLPLNGSIQAITDSNDKVVNCQAEIGDKLVLFILGELK